MNDNTLMMIIAGAVLVIALIVVQAIARASARRRAKNDAHQAHRRNISERR